MGRMKHHRQLERLERHLPAMARNNTNSVRSSELPHAYHVIDQATPCFGFPVVTFFQYLTIHIPQASE